MQSLKKRKIEQARSCVTSYEISVKINSSSSRSSIFTNSLDEREPNTDTTPSILEAILPLEVENGRRVSKARAKTVAESLGSYNIQHGQPTLPSGKNSIRALAGRTRLVWTSKKLSDQPQRVSFTSLVTGHKLENGAQKRPREIRVRIKVDGEICNDWKTVGQGRQEDYKKRQKNSRSDVQATLQCDQLVQNLFHAKNDRTKSLHFIPPLIECVPDNAGSIHVVCTSPGSILQSSISPILKLAAKRSNPRCTICWRSTEGGAEVKECAECGLLAHVECCLDPGEISVRPLDGDLESKEEWKCSVCCYRNKNQTNSRGTNNAPHNMSVVKKSKGKPRPHSRLTDPFFESTQTQKKDHCTVAIKEEIRCAICFLSGGAMSQVSVEGNTFWVHETCRIWTSDEISSSNNLLNRSCVLCGSNCFPRKTESTKSASRNNCLSRCVVKCAAVGCNISVHPMCALVSSLASQSMKESGGDSPGNSILDDVRKAKKKDIELCSQYTLTFASVNGISNAFGKDPGTKCAASLPILFCGIHNPAREQSFHGLYPGGKFMDIKNTLTVPSC
mmetsp:Transcript_8599/g.20542  ORF Transcript_8599/g.20542 Transcript_8599/m.20542 type:complete len:560 (+) Transcript_8599:53-1732(+)